MSYKHHEPGDRISGNSKTGGKFSDLAPRVIHESKGPWTIVDDLIFKAQCVHVTHRSHQAQRVRGEQEATLAQHPDMEGHAYIRWGRGAVAPETNSEHMAI